jgi:ketosteroid isomerase-like protein
MHCPRCNGVIVAYRSSGTIEVGRAQKSIRATPIAICDAFNAHDLDRIMYFFAEDCVLELPKENKPYR